METKGKRGPEIRLQKPDRRNSETQECDSRNSPLRVKSLRACLETTRALRRGILAVAKAALAARSAPQRAVRNEPTPATDKRPAARRVFAEKAVRLRCSSVEDPRVKSLLRLLRGQSRKAEINS